MAQFLSSKDINSTHTLDLPDRNATPDHEIIKLADKEDRIVISKDSDFWDNYILEGRPQKLLIVSTGNISNSKLIRLFEQNIEALKSLFEESAVIEIDEELTLARFLMRVIMAFRTVVLKFQLGR